jgi:hypothetical protein
LILGLSTAGVVCPTPAGASGPCTIADFEAVVDQASSTLVDLAQKNTPDFQSRLRALKDKRGWTHEQFVTAGAPFVQDATIQAYDDRSQALLMRINAGTGEAADCTVLADLRAALATLIETQAAKWTYMFDKIDRELAK